MTGFEGKLMKSKTPQSHNAPGFSKNNDNDTTTTTTTTTTNNNNNNNLETRMEVVKMNANLLPPVTSSYETQIKAEICPECNTY